MHMGILGINHVTFAVRDLEVALAFYTKVLGMKLEASWTHGAYLCTGATWIALNVDSKAAPTPDCSHLAFSVTEQTFDSLAQRIRAAGAPIWQDNKSEGQSLYFLDPDGHKLELHVGTLTTRLKAMTEKPPLGFALL